MTRIKCLGTSKHKDDFMIEIYRDGPPMEETVVRWCKECGAIIVDLDCGGRVYPGRITSMTWPNIIKKVNT